MKAGSDQDPDPSPLTGRCNCDYLCDYWKTDHSTKKFISLLPLPRTVKSFVKKVARELCHDIHADYDEEMRLEDEWEAERWGWCEFGTYSPRPPSPDEWDSEEELFPDEEVDEESDEAEEETNKDKEKAMEADTLYKSFVENLHKPDFWDP